MLEDSSTKPTYKAFARHPSALQAFATSIPSFIVCFSSLFQECGPSLCCRPPWPLAFPWQPL